MHTLLNRIRRLVPGFAPPAIALVLAVNCMVYYGARLINEGRPHISMWTSLDAMVPFLPAFSFFYVLAYVQWAAGYLLMAHEGRPFALHWYACDILAKLLAGVCFLLVPTMLIRPEVTGSSPAQLLVRHLYRIDAPDNLFPSIHCLESWICLRSAWQMKKMPSGYRVLSLIMTILVFASTVCIRQHVLVDIPGGILAVEIGVMIESRVHLADRLLSKLPSLW